MRLVGTGLAETTQAELAKPLIAAAEGYALAGGFEIMLACDMMVAWSAAKSGLSEVKRGLVRLHRQMPIKLASEFVLTGDTLPAQRPEDAGPVKRIVPEEEVLGGAIALTWTIAANGPLTVSTSHRILRESLDWPESEMFERQFEITAPVFTSDNARKGAAAFADNRKPVWQGHCPGEPAKDN